MSNITIEVCLPEIRNPGVTVSNCEIMEKIKEGSSPEEYQNLCVELSVCELIRFSGEFDSVRALCKVVLLLNGKKIKLQGFPDPQLSHQIPVLPGKWSECSDTVHVKGLPVRWFASKVSHGKPCPKVLTDAFARLGFMILLLNQTRKFGPGAATQVLNFKVYIQYEKYSAAMEGLENMQIMTRGKDIS